MRLIAFSSNAQDAVQWFKLLEISENNKLLQLDIVSYCVTINSIILNQALVFSTKNSDPFRREILYLPHEPL